MRKGIFVFFFVGVLFLGVVVSGCIGGGEMMIILSIS